MKKILLYAFAICIALCFSCKKDDNGGSVSPTIKKVLKDTYGDYIYATYISEDQENWELFVEGEIDNVLIRDYIYDGDKLIVMKQISFNDTYGWTDSISYSEDGAVTQIIEYFWELGYDSDCYKYDLVYDNGLITKINCYYEGDYLGSYYDYFYTDNKLSKVVYTDVDYDKAPKHHRDKKFNHRNDIYCTEINWTGDNVTQIKEVGEGWEHIATYDYDNKNNPYIENDAFVAYSYISLDFVSLSKNNVTFYSTNFDYNVMYSYEYKDNYPSEEEFCYEYIYEYNGRWYKNNETYHYYLNYKQ